MTDTKFSLIPLRQFEANIPIVKKPVHLQYKSASLGQFLKTSHDTWTKEVVFELWNTQCK